MTKAPELDMQRAHRFFAANCFNQTWTILDLPERSARSQEEMLLLSYASLWHWTQREDCTDQKRSVGYWLVSRVHATLGQGANAAEFASKCLAVSASLPPFYRAYAHESMARAARVSGDDAGAALHLKEARKFAEEVADPEERRMIDSDLNSL